LKNGVRVPSYTLPSDWLMREFADEFLRGRVDLNATRLVDKKPLHVFLENFGFKSERALLAVSSREEELEKNRQAIKRLELRIDNMNKNLVLIDEARKKELKRFKGQETKRSEGLRLRRDRISDSISSTILDLRERQVVVDAIVLRHDLRETYRTALAWVLLLARSLELHLEDIPPVHDHVLHTSELSHKKENPAVELARKKLTAQRKFWSRFSKTDTTSIEDIYKRFRTEEEWIFCPIHLKYL